jgi:hypothetical protein
VRNNFGSDYRPQSSLIVDSPSSLAAVQRPGDSWVAKYQGIREFVKLNLKIIVMIQLVFPSEMMKPGVYALEMKGTLDPDIEDYLKQKNIPYRVKFPGL